MIYAYWKERVKHAVRFRHKRGFGVHSPFMFNFILNVVRDKRHCFVYPEEISTKRGMGHRERKFYRLFYRIAVFLKVRRIVCFTVKKEWGRDCLLPLEGMDRIEYNQLEALQSADMVYIGRDSRSYLMGRERMVLENVGRKKQCVVITDIHKNSFNASLWRALAIKANVRMDMMWYGILLFDDKLQKGKYHLIL